MLQMVKRILFMLVPVVMCCCDKLDLKGLIMPTGDGVEKRFEQSLEMNEGLNVAAVEVEESYTFYVAADPHINETHRNLSIFNDALRNDGEASFGIILGDCTDAKDRLPNYLRALAYNPEQHAYNHRIFHILGNHDVFFNGWADFKEYIGPSVYWFEVLFEGGKDLYIALDTATGTLGRKQTEWLKSFLAGNRKLYRHCVVLTHTNFFYTDTSQNSSGNMPIEESLSLISFWGKQKVTLVLQGHDHYRENLVYDKVRYITLGAIRDEMDYPEYLKVKADKGGMSFDWQLIP